MINYLKRALNDNECEYEIENTTNEREKNFLDTFKLFNKNENLDIKEYQIIINPIKQIIEIRIHMNKLQRCFSFSYDLEILMDDRGCLNICYDYLYRIKVYAEKLCYKEGI